MDKRMPVILLPLPQLRPPPSTLMMTLLMIENIVPGTHGMARIGRVHGIALVVVVRGA